KFASHSVGEMWHPDKKMRVNRDFRHCFDGKDAIWLLQGQGAHYVHGDVVVGADIHTVGLLSNEFVTGLRLGDAPNEWLEHKGYLVPKMSVRDSKATDENGRACIEMSLPMEKGGPMGTLLLDPSRDYLPVKLVHRANGVVTLTLTVDYAPNEQARW